MKIAIVVVAYNRVDSLTRLLKSLEKASYPEGKNITLIISVDKSDTDVVEKYADNYKWPFGDIIVDKHEKNLGLKPHMMSLGKWFEKFDSLVVLEDDIVVSPGFYNYTVETVDKYHNNDSIAGISLYGFNVNYHTGIPFEPIRSLYDVYFMNCAMSWGEVWMRESWREFYNWYTRHHEFPVLSHLPSSICHWNEKSWLKYHTRYCIEENKYFVYPYSSLATNYGDAGVHNNGTLNTVYQVPCQYGCKKAYSLPELSDDVVCYDGFFENNSLYHKLNLNKEELCLDLYGEWKNRLKKHFWLTTEIHNYKIIKSFGLNYRPIEMNVLLDNPGNYILLYDTTIVEKNPYKKRRNKLLYHYHLTNMFYFVRRYGYLNTIRDFVELVKHKIWK